MERQTNAERPIHWKGDSANIEEYRRWDNPNSLLTAAVESANDAILITDATLDEPGPQIEYVNPAFTKMTGYSQDEIRGKTPRILQGPKTDRALLRRLRDDLRDSRAFHGETVNYRKDGSEYFVEWRITCLTDDDGNVVKWVAIQRDVTPRVLAEQERDELLVKERIARKEIEQQSKMKDEFLATLSHELRTPLNAIVGWSQLLIRNREPSDLEEGLHVIERNARAQTQLIGDLLDMSRIITGKLRLDVQKVDLHEVILGAIASVQHSADQKQIRLTTVLDPLAGPVSGDPSRLQQVVWNLLSNAIKFTKAHGRIQVVLERVNSHVEIAISDSGIGIRPEFLPVVFDRFRQADATTTRQQGGLGIGLAIVKQLVELHGGQIRAKSPGEGSGSTFIVSLPVAIVHHADAVDILPPTVFDDGQPEDIECPAALEGLKVLVVDDEPDTRNLLRRMVENCKAVVTVAASVDEALALFKQSRPDVLLSDIGMPNKDGYELIRSVRKLSKRDGGQVPAAALTAFARSEDRRRSLIAGFDMHIPKPVEPAELIAVVSRLAKRDRA